MTWANPEQENSYCSVESSGVLLEQSTPSNLMINLVVILLS
jgi:hypothetical protein